MICDYGFTDYGFTAYGRDGQGPQVALMDGLWRALELWQSTVYVTAATEAGPRAGGRGVAEERGGANHWVSKEANPIHSKSIQPSSMGLPWG